MYLEKVREAVLKHCDRLLDRDGPYGCYRIGPHKRVDLYSSCDIALMRAIMGEDLRATVSPGRRQEWIDHINSFASNSFGKATDGSYFDTNGHSVFHANGMVIGALGVLGGRQKFPCRLYEAFNTPEKVVPWLESLDWPHQWPGSHLFWGGMVCYSMSRACTPAWRESVFRWLNDNLDTQTGWWRRGIPNADRNQPLGGSVHILPIYQHHSRPFPCPERVIDSVLSLQLPYGGWLQTRAIGVTHQYLDLDALYALWFMRTLAPNYRTNDIARSVGRYADRITMQFDRQRDAVFALHPHSVLSFVGAFGLLQRLAPDRFSDRVAWTDIFSDRRLHDTAAVEVLPARATGPAA